MNNIYKTLKEDGVVLTKDFFNENEISKVRDEYDRLIKVLQIKKFIKKNRLLFFGNMFRVNKKE